MRRHLHRWTAGLGAAAVVLAVLPGQQALAAPPAPAPAPPSPTATSLTAPGLTAPGPTAPGPAATRAPVAGGRSVGDSLFPTIGNTGYDVRHYAIALTYRSDRTIVATTTVQATARRPLSTFSLDLEGLSVDGVRVDRRPATFRRSGTKLVVTPQRPAGGRFVVTVRYHGKPVTHIDPDGAEDGWVPSATGATALSEPVGAQTWFPNNNTPRDKASFDVALTVPKSLAAASNGVLRSRRSAHGQTTWRWRQRQPMATYLSLLAIGRFDVHRDTVHLQHGRRITSWSFVQPSFGSLKAQRALVGRAVAFSEREYGRYPFDSVGIVVQDLGVGYALETQTRPFFDGVPDDSTLVHELAHQWFGDSVTPRDWGDIWLNEGFATYAEDNWAAAHGGPGVAAAFRQTYDANGRGSDLWSPAPDALSDPADLFGEPVYVRGGLTLEALRHRIGARAMRTLLRTWTRRHAYGVVATSDFVRLAERVSGQELDAFFRTWLVVPAKPAGY